MRVVIASGNIFRRELSSYILDEAGYTVEEACSAEALLTSLHIRAPAVLVLDSQLDGAEPGITLRAVRMLSSAPIMWVAEPPRARPLLMVDHYPADSISWPYSAAELITAINRLLGRAEAAPDTEAHREHCASPAE